mmetsp:Transcript_98067/g.277599  ORF Transcript_98067/g.277599 Transcript_98067/m.277599 type:complete len:214 (-) Transcript_98067:899-1540(-)
MGRREGGKDRKSETERERKGQRRLHALHKRNNWNSQLRGPAPPQASARGTPARRRGHRRGRARQKWQLGERALHSPSLQGAAAGRRRPRRQLLEHGLLPRQGAEEQLLLARHHGPGARDAHPSQQRAPRNVPEVDDEHAREEDAAAEAALAVHGDGPARRRALLLGETHLGRTVQEMLEDACGRNGTLHVVEVTIRVLDAVRFQFSRLVAASQ